jgi:hypothetical protein
VTIAEQAKVTLLSFGKQQMIRLRRGGDGSTWYCHAQRDQADEQRLRLPTATITAKAVALRHGQIVAAQDLGAGACYRKHQGDAILLSVLLNSCRDFVH